VVEDSRTPAELHEAGEVHSPEGCWPCFAVTMADLGRRIREGLAPILDELAKALDADFDADGAPRQVQHGPPERRPRAPRDHSSNTGLAARSRASNLTQRNALRRR
jgi:hypothetical protein